MGYIMKRHYYISDDLDDLEHVEEELEKAGLATPQIHVLSTKDAEVAHHHHLHEVESLMKKDIVHGTEIGALVGVCAAAVVLAVAYFTGWHETVTWVPFIFLAIIVLGFCSWEGGLFGLRLPNHHFKRFQELLKEGKHIFFVDVDPEQEAVLESVVNAHPRLELAGEGKAAPRWIVRGQQRWKEFVHWAP